MRLRRSKPFLQQYSKLSQPVRNKLHRQLKALASDYNHSSLHTKKIKGSKKIWEARVDYQYRFTFEFEGTTIILRKVGPHDILKKP